MDARYAPHRPLPPYAFLPGRDPHPTRDRDGHSYGADETPPPYLPPERWAENDDYLYGVDLYNLGYLWEAHEAWEGIWHVSKHDPDQADLLQGLIQCAAACLKIPMGQPAGVEKLARLGTEKLRRVAAARGAEPFMGIELAVFADELAAFAASHPASIEGRPSILLEARPPDAQGREGGGAG